ncbi:hypothetical protein HRbin30_01334 [bacterium HR30]|nr:hypothetical protein HRbin30_01334 [bacterium HR30]
MAYRCRRILYAVGRPIVLAAGIVALLVAMLGCRDRFGEAPLAGADVVLIVVDTLRADHLGFHGYTQPTSPFLDRLAAESAVFTDVLAPSSYTRESIAALFSGHWPSCIGAIGWNASPRKAPFTLAERLGASGYATAMLTLTTMLSDPGFARGFERIEHLTAQWGVSRAGPELTRRALEVFGEPRTRPLFLYLHYLDPHGPYDPPTGDARTLCSCVQYCPRSLPRHPSALAGTRGCGVRLARPSIS